MTMTQLKRTLDVIQGTLERGVINDAARPVLMDATRRMTFARVFGIGSFLANEVRQGRVTPYIRIAACEPRHDEAACFIGGDPAGRRYEMQVDVGVHKGRWYPYSPGLNACIWPIPIELLARYGNDATSGVIIGDVGVAYHQYHLKYAIKALLRQARLNPVIPDDARWFLEVIGPKDERLRAMLGEELAGLRRFNIDQSKQDPHYNHSCCVVAELDLPNSARMEIGSASLASAAWNDHANGRSNANIMRNTALGIMRRLIQPQISAFRNHVERVGGVCPETGQPVGQGHPFEVDHDSDEVQMNSFGQIVVAYRELKHDERAVHDDGDDLLDDVDAMVLADAYDDWGHGMTAFVLRDGVMCFADRAFEAGWPEHHRTHAKLVALSPEGHRIRTNKMMAISGNGQGPEDMDGEDDDK
ncbi:hypothetical protein LCM28_05655 [Salipiger pacificus]|nr:hypothetical protein [Alloyangia pacifica]